MDTIVVILALALIAAVWITVVTKSKEPFTGRKSRQYVIRDTVNFPGNDLDPNGAWVKDTAACSNLCDARANECFGFSVMTKADPTQPKNANRKCYLKKKEALSTETMVVDKTWTSHVLKSYYDYWRGNFAGQGTGKSWTKKCIGKQVTLWADVEKQMTPKYYGCGEYDISADFPLGGMGVTAYSVPAGLKMKLYGIPAKSSQAQWSSEIVGPTDNNLTQWGGIWNDRVTKIRVEAA